MPVRLPPNDPREWIQRARSSLAIARCREPDIYREDLCYQAQQAAEKSIKAVYISKKLAFTHIHDISQLLAALENVQS
jgi:HEPN domain-containing protein